MLEGDGRTVTRELVCDQIKRITDALVREKAQNAVDTERLSAICSNIRGTRFKKGLSAVYNDVSL